MTIPEEVRSKANIKVGDRLIVEYNNVANTINIRVPVRKRTTMKLGRDITVEEIEGSIEKGLKDCLRY